MPEEKTALIISDKDGVVEKKPPLTPTTLEQVEERGLVPVGLVDEIKNKLLVLSSRVEDQHYDEGWAPLLYKDVASIYFDDNGDIIIFDVSATIGSSPDKPRKESRKLRFGAMIYHEDESQDSFSFDLAGTPGEVDTESVHIFHYGPKEPGGDELEFKNFEKIPLLGKEFPPVVEELMRKFLDSEFNKELSDITVEPSNTPLGTRMTNWIREKREELKSKK